MSFFPAKDPAPGDARAANAIDLVVVPRSVDVGHFTVRRALPHVQRRMVGPFIFLDHFGPRQQLCIFLAAVYFGVRSDVGACARASSSARLKVLFDGS